MDFIELIKIIIIGIVEGITEWLPISSTGHMRLLDEIMPLRASTDFKNMFFVVIQLGAILAVVVAFFNKLMPITFKNGIKIKNETISLWLKVAFACLPSVVGIFLDDFLDKNLNSPFIIAAMLIIYGIIFIILENRNKSKKATTTSIEKLSYKSAFIIGMFQVLAMIPGTSRSGATIIGALLIGISRTVAAEFTFFLAIPTMFAASGLKLLKFGFDFTSTELLMLSTGMIVAFIVSLLTIKFLMNYIKSKDFKAFGWYRIILGIIVILFFTFI